MNLREFLAAQGKRAGLSDDQEFQLMLAASTLADIEVPESVNNKFQSNLLDMEVAKYNPDLKKHFIGNYMMGYDEEVVNLAKEYGLSGEAVMEIKSTKNSGDKVKLAFKHLKDLEEAAKKSGNKNQSDEYVKQIADAQQKLDEALAKAAAEKSEVESKYINRMQTLWEQAQLSSIAWNDNIPEAARIPAYKAVVSNKLNELGGKIVFDAETNNAQIVNSNDPSLPLVINGKTFGYKDLQTLVLQENNLLRQSGNSGSSGAAAQGTNPYLPPINNGGQGTIPKHISAALDRIDSMAAQLNSQE